MSTCCHCGYCCTKAPCVYGLQRYHCKRGFPCPGLTADNLCRVYLVADEDLRAEMEGIWGVGIGAGCCCPMFNTVRDAKLQKMREPNENPPLRIHYLADLVKRSKARADISILPPYDITAGRSWPWISLGSSDDGVHLLDKPRYPFDVQVVIRCAKTPGGASNTHTVPLGHVVRGPLAIGFFQASYVCRDVLGPLYLSSSEIPVLEYRGSGYAILAYLALMEILRLFQGWLAPESRFGGMTSPDAWQTWMRLQSLDEVYHRNTTTCTDRHPHEDRYHLTEPIRVWQYEGPRVLGGILPATVGSHISLQIGRIATGQKVMSRYNDMLRQWLKGQ